MICPKCGSTKFAGKQITRYYETIIVDEDKKFITRVSGTREFIDAGDPMPYNLINSWKCTWCGTRIIADTD